MTRNSFIQMSKLPNVKGRINYITSKARQENLYATYNTTDNKFWRNLATECQQEFKHRGGIGTCVEAREIIIALPESFVEYDPQLVLEDFTNYFKDCYGVECISALHHNKAKTNYHIHLIFAERKLLAEPIIKVATRNVFFDENNKRVRTKKEILDSNGIIRAGCRIIPKGEIYEQHLFSPKEDWFKHVYFLESLKEDYTEFINCNVEDKDKKLTVFDKNDVYLPTIKIGKNNPRADEIKQENDVRMDWNRTADSALINGVPKQEILDIKSQEIYDKATISYSENGKKAGAFIRLIKRAKNMLLNLIRKFGKPIKPKLEIDSNEYKRLCDIYNVLCNNDRKMNELENITIPKLKAELEALKGPFKKKARTECETTISEKEKELNDCKAFPEQYIKSNGFNSISEFMDKYDKYNQAYIKYRDEVRDYDYWVYEQQENERKEKLKRKYENRHTKHKSKELDRER